MERSQGIYELKHDPAQSASRAAARYESAMIFSGIRRIKR
jgi:hypothetical protein